MTTPGLPPLFGAPWERQEDRKAAAEVAYSLRAKADREQRAQQGGKPHRVHLRDLDQWITGADQALTAAHREAGDLAAMATAGSTERTKWVDYTNKIAHIQNEMRRMLREMPYS